MAMSTVLLSCAGTVQQNLDWRHGTPIGVTLTTTGGSTGVVTVQLTLDDLDKVAAANVVWVNDPNFTTVGTSLTSISCGVILYQQPLGGIRLNSTASNGGTITMKVNQAMAFG